MTSRLIIILFSLVMAGAVHGQFLYTLSSPNEEEEGFFGHTVSGAGDFNLDGYDDVVVSAYWEDPGSAPHNTGRAYLFHGRTTELLHTFVSPNQQEHGHFGVSVSWAGNVNNDFVDDIIIGAFNETPLNEPMNSGRAYVFSGWSGNLLHTLVSPNAEVDGHFGVRVAYGGRLLSGGIDYVLVSAFAEDPGSSPTGAGRVYAYNGWSGQLFRTFSSPNEEQDGWFGYSIASAGDTNGDTADDIIVGASGEDPGTSPIDAGRAYVFDGLTGALRYTLVAPSEVESAHFGHSVDGAGDVNNDGHDDVIVGAPWGGYNQRGAAYIYNGQTGDLLFALSSPRPESGEQFGCRVAGIGDIDRDGYDDVLVGANREDPESGPTDAGMAYVFTSMFAPPDGHLAYHMVSPNAEEEGLFGTFLSGAGDVNGDGYQDVVIGAHVEDPGSSPTDAGRAYVFSPVTLSATRVDGGTQLEWLYCTGPTFYWFYGADNETFFVPGFTDPWEYRIAALPVGYTSLIIPAGFGDPDHNWTFLMAAVDFPTPHILWVTNRVGEFDYQLLTR